MGSETVAWIVAVVLAVAVLGLGWGRKLSVTTRDWLPRFEGGRVRPQPSYVQGRGSRRMSRRQRRGYALAYLTFGVSWATIAALSAHERSIHFLMAGGWAVSGVVFWLRSRRQLED